MLTTLALTAAAHGLTPQDITPEFCNGVPQEVTRVESELQSTTSRLQREWLERQLKALTIKKDLCINANILD